MLILNEANPVLEVVDPKLGGKFDQLQVLVVLKTGSDVLGGEKQHCRMQ